MKNNFNYTYSAPQQDEIKKIRQKYIPLEQQQSDLETLRRLDKSVETPGVVISLILGVAGTLLLGVGMCCTMVWTKFFVLGIIVGIIGIITLSFAYPAYKKITKARREKFADEIIRLADELENKQ